MRLVVQRTSGAQVRVDGTVTGRVDAGLVVLVGVGRETREEDLDWLAAKLVDLRIFPDDEGRMNRSVRDVGGGLLLISQFTLYGDVRKGRRPSFVGAAPPDDGERLYEAFVDRVRQFGVPVATGVFGAQMEVDLVNDGPVTLVIER